MTKMTNINHHLTDELIMGYSAGKLPEAIDLLIATHISMCDDCRAAMESYDALGGALLEDDTLITDIADMDDGSLAATLALIGEQKVSTTMPVISDVPAPLAGYIGGSLSDVRWRPVGMGVRQAILQTEGDAVARLLHIPAGVAIPHHSHGGLELTLVLKGAFTDEDGHFGPGDVEIADENTDHTPVADLSEDCYCLAVTDASLKFKSLLPKLIQPFVRI